MAAIRELAYASGPNTSALLGETIGVHVERTVEAFGDRLALVDIPAGRRYTYREFDEQVNVLAFALLERGLEKGDRVGIWAQNCAEWSIVQYATAKLGVILVNVNPAYRTHELQFVVEQSGMRMLISQITASHSDFSAMAREVASEAPLDLVFLDTMAPEFVGSAPVAGEESYAGLLARGAELAGDAARKIDVKLAQRMAELDPDDPINIQYTSGTTGFPKGATLSHHNILNNGYSIGEMLGYDESDVVVLPVPFYHCFGMVIGNLAIYSHGSAAVIPSASYDPAAALRAVEQERATSLYGVPTMFIGELELEDFAEYDLSTLRTGVMAGSPCPVEVMKRVISEMHMSEVAICYGMTETSPVSTMTRVDDSLERRTETVGRVMPSLEIKIVDPVTGEIVPRGERGEFCTRGYSVMRGYWDEEAKTAEAIDAGGWMHTGDLAVMNPDGYVQITGRIKDMVIRGGENIYPREIEEFLYQHPSIRDVQVIGVPDDKYGEELMAWVVLRAGVDSLTVDEVREFSRGKLAHYKIPRYIHITDSFPMTISGKIRKVEMRETSASLLAESPGAAEV